jgi:hypothetical protein
MITLCIAAVIFIASRQSDGSATTPTTHTVTYKVTGVGNALITYSKPAGIEQITAKLPLTNTDGDPGISWPVMTGDVLTLSAQDQTGLGAALTCEIDIDGSPISTNTSRGAYSVVTCDGLTP